MGFGVTWHVRQDPVCLASDRSTIVAFSLSVENRLTTLAPVHTLDVLSQLARDERLPLIAIDARATRAAKWEPARGRGFRGDPRGFSAASPLVWAEERLESNPSQRARMRMKALLAQQTSAWA
jgi:hypothetical protein